MGGEGDVGVGSVGMREIRNEVVETPVMGIPDESNALQQVFRRFRVVVWAARHKRKAIFTLVTQGKKGLQFRRTTGLTMSRVRVAMPSSFSEFITLAYSMDGGFSVISAPQYR
jgi:hypothetical protein